MSMNKEEKETPQTVLLKVLNALYDDVRVEVLNMLKDGEMISFRSLARRLGVNHKKLKKNISALIRNDLIEEVQIKVSDGRVYRAYRLRGGISKILNTSGNPTNIFRVVLEFDHLMELTLGISSYSFSIPHRAYPLRPKAFSL